MNAENARAVADAMGAIWEGEFPATVRVLSAVNNENRDYRPDPKSRSSWELATHIATADIWFIDCIIQGAFAFDPAAAQQAQAQFKNVDDVVAFYQKAFPAKLAELRALSSQQLAETVDFFGMMQMPRAQWIGFANNHCVHHRGQLSAHLRAMGSRVPDIYGPSADSAEVAASA